MNFTREPIIESVISAREGNKLKLTSTKKDSSKEYLVYAVEVVSFGSSLFYRSNEPGNIFFFPVQDFEIEQVRQARMILKTPEDKAIKIAGGQDTSKSKSSEKKQKTDKAKKPKKAVKPTSEVKEGSKEDKDAPKEKSEKSAETTSDKQSAKSDAKESKDTAKKPATKVTSKDTAKESSKSAKQTKTKTTRKTTKRQTAKKDETSNEQTEKTPSLFSHLLRPPEGLISDNIDRYLTNDKKETQAAEKVEEGSTVKEEGSDQTDDPNLASEPPKPFEKLEEEQSVAIEANEEGSKEEVVLTIKERMKKVLSTGIKKPEKEESKE